MVAALLDRAGVDALRRALAGYTVPALYGELPADAADALGRGDLPRLRRTLTGDDALTTLVRLFVLADPVAEPAAARALAPLPLAAARAGGLLVVSGGQVRARLDIRPYTDDRFGQPWWVLSDFGTDVRPGPLPAGHVLGIGSASLTLTGATVPVSGGRALDLGTGSGVAALPLGAAGASVVATDINDRALAMAATAAALAGQSWDLRRGSLTDPVAGERFDIIVSNPPFVVSPGLAAGSGGFDYRDSGLAADGVIERLLTGLPELLEPGGTAQLLANWVIPPDGSWDQRLTSWLSGRGVDAWIWQREALDPVAYITLWLRDAGEDPSSPRWAERFDAWLDWFRRSGTFGVGMGVVTLRRIEDPARPPVIVCEDVRQDLDTPTGPHIAGWLERADWVARTPDGDLLAAALRHSPDLELATRQPVDAEGWRPGAPALVQTAGMHFTVPTDPAVAGLVAAADGTQSLGVLAAVLAAGLDQPTEAVCAALLPVVRDLLRRGILLPPGRRAALAAR